MTETHFVRGASRLKRRFATIQAATTLALSENQLGAFMEKRVKARFVKKVDPDNRPWPKLEPSTVRRQKYERGKGALRRTDRLYNAIKVIRGSSAGLFAGATGLGFRVGVDDEEASAYGRLQNYGFWHVRGQRKVPARRFIGVGALDVQAVDAFLRRIIVKQGLEK